MKKEKLKLTKEGEKVADDLLQEYVGISKIKIKQLEKDLKVIHIISESYRKERDKLLANVKLVKKNCPYCKGTDKGECPYCKNINECFKIDKFK